MLRRRFAVPFMLLLAAAALPAALYAQLETGDRGILPLDSSEHAGDRRNPCRCRRRRCAERALCRLADRAAAGLQGAVGEDAQCAGRRRRRTLPDGTLDQIVSSINVEREQIGPNRYIADLGVQFDRSRAAPVPRGRGRAGERSAPMLLIPVTVSGGHRDQRRAAQCLAARMGRSSDRAKPDRLCASQRHGRRPVAGERGADGAAGARLVAQPADMYGASDILVAEVQLQRLYPGGPARARFIARHGPDNEIVGGFTLTAAEQRRDSGDDGAGRAADRPALRAGARGRAADAR